MHFLFIRLSRMARCRIAVILFRSLSLVGTFLITIFDWLQPTKIVALGADAESAVMSVGYPCRRVRHPSYGGQGEFAREIRNIYQIPCC